MNWNGEKFMEYGPDVVSIKQYDTMEQALAAWDEAIKVARGDYLIKHRDLIEEYVTVWADGRHWGQVTTELEDENSTIYKQVNALIMITKDNAYQIYKTDISELSEAARERCVFKALAFIQAYDAKQMAKARVQYGVDWALVF